MMTGLVLLVISESEGILGGNMRIWL